MKKAIKRTIVILLVIYALILVAYPVILTTVICNKHVEHGKIFTAEEASLPNPDTLSLMTSDGYKIHTLELLPEGDIKGAVVCISGIENPSVTAFYGHARLFRELGMITYLPDMRAHGKSDGDRISLAYKETADVKAVTDHIKENYPDVPVVVMGLSMGGAIAIRSIGENPDIDALISSSAYSSIQDFLYWQAGRFISKPLAYPVKLSAGVVSGLIFKVNAFKETPLNSIKNLNGRPALMMQSDGDTQVPYYCFKKLTKEASKATDRLTTYVTEGDIHFITDSFGTPEADETYYNTVKTFLEEEVLAK